MSNYWLARNLSENDCILLLRIKFEVKTSIGALRKVKFWIILTSWQVKLNATFARSSGAK